MADFLTEMLTNKVLEQSKKSYERGLLPLLGSQRLIKARAYNDLFSQGMLFAAFLLISFAPIIIVYGISYTPLETIEESPLLSLLVFLCIMICMVAGAGLLLYDLDNVECYFLGYKQSSYYRSTYVNKRVIPQDRGLIGEFKSYVLSRKITIPHKVLYNVCVPMPNGNFQEVDSIIITPNMIYVLECKNRAGNFVGSYNDKKWTQYIGRQQHETENIYMQNQKHTMAIDHFLLSRGIIENGSIVCMNVVLRTASMTLPTENMPLDFAYGDAKYIAKTMQQFDRQVDDGTDTSGIMEEVYRALLPYALYTQQERALMLQERQIRSERKELMIGEFQYKSIPGGIPGITDPGQAAYIRWNRCYTQIYNSQGTDGCWVTRTDIPEHYKQ